MTQVKNVGLNYFPVITAQWDEQETREMYTVQISPPDMDVGGIFEISITFTSMLNDELRGFYRSRYDDNGVTKYNCHSIIDVALDLFNCE